MKRWTYAVLAGVLACGALSAHPLRAEEGGEGMEEAEHHGGMPMDKLKGKLGLSDDQAGKLKAAMKAMEDASKPLREQSRASMKKLRDQIKAKAPDADIQATLDQLKKTHDAMRAEHEKFRASADSVLTPTQKGKMLLHMMKRMRHGGWKGHEVRGGEHEDEEGDKPADSKK